MVPWSQQSPHTVRCECVCGCDSSAGQDGVLWACTSHCEAPVCGACVALIDPLICHWCMNPEYVAPDRRPQGIIPWRCYTVHGFVGIYNPPLERINDYGWIVPLAGTTHQSNPMYNDDGIRTINNFNRCFFSPSIVKIPINAGEFFIRARYIGMEGGPKTRGTVNIFRGNERYGTYYCDVFKYQPPCKCGKCHNFWLRRGWRCTPPPWN